MTAMRAIAAFPARNRLFTTVLAAAAAVRVITIVAFRPALWFGGDSASYLAVALRLRPDVSRESGYGLMLFVLRPLHSVLAIVVVQHLMGLLMGVGIYLLLRERFGLPAWGATLAAVPVLFDAYQIQLEHEVLSDVLFEFLIVAALFIVLWWRRGRSGDWAGVWAAFLLGCASIVRPVGLPLVALLICYLVARHLARHGGWRAVGAAVAAAAAPIVMYLAWFGAAYHSVNLTRAEGIYLWGRTMSFANCAVIKPPADETWLCPPDTGHRMAASSYVWVNSPLVSRPGGRFTASNNRLALDFAVRAITAQPAGYAGAVLHDFMLSFHWNRPPHPSAFTASKYQFATAEKLWVSPSLATGHGGTVRTDQRAYSGGAAIATRAHEPYAGFMREYQRFVYLRGTLLGVILLIGLAGIVRSWRNGGIRRLRGWGGPALLPWLTAMGLLLAPVATTDFDLRYVVPAVPVACLAAALGFARKERGRKAAPAAVTGASSAGVLQASGHTAHREEQQPLQ